MKCFRCNRQINYLNKEKFGEVIVCLTCDLLFIPIVECNQQFIFKKVGMRKIES